VAKGQAIGQADFEPAPEQIGQALNKAVARSGRIQAGANQAEERGGHTPVVAPADGLILEGDAGTGTFGIAADPNRLSVAVLVSDC
jgi:hypothetical protein